MNLIGYKFVGNKDTAIVFQKFLINEYSKKCAKIMDFVFQNGFVSLQLIVDYIQTNQVKDEITNKIKKSL